MCVCFVFAEGTKITFFPLFYEGAGTVFVFVFFILLLYSLATRLHPMGEIIKREAGGMEGGKHYL